MIRNYFKTAWRNILKNKFYAAINIAGLTLGLTIGLLILLWVTDELSFDKFHTRAGQFYQAQAQIGTGTSKQIWAGVQGPVATYALKEVPGVQNPFLRYSILNY
jgi:putative ABC transport system permease protein